MKPTLYIHKAACISPQISSFEAGLDSLNEPVNNKLQVVEPPYENIPHASLRRMGKAVRIGVGAALPLLAGSRIDGIVLGTANGGMEDCIKFLNQMRAYDEGLLTPGNFVQSTPNSIAAQVAMITANQGYNITHVHRGLAFENALMDVGMLISEHPEKSYLLGGVDEISSFNHNIDNLAGWYKKELVSGRRLYTANTPGTIAGEGASMFLVNGTPEAAIARIEALLTIHNENQEDLKNLMQSFLEQQIQTGESIDLLLSGENGDCRYLQQYLSCEEMLNNYTAVARFKHMSGEYETASAFALWLACHIFLNQSLPGHMIKKQEGMKNYQRILIYNNFKSVQHSLILVSKV